MSARRDPRRKSFFDSPSGHDITNDDSDQESAVPRRKRRTRRVSVGANTVFTTNDGFQYRRRQTLIDPKLQNKTRVSTPTNSATQGNRTTPSTSSENKRARKSSKKTSSSEDGAEEINNKEPNTIFVKRLTDSSKFKKIPKKSADETTTSSHEYPLYPDTSDWEPKMHEHDEMSAEVKFLDFLKQMVSFEICQSSCVYLKEEHKFISDRIELTCKAFLAKANEAVLKILDETGPLKKPEILRNPANDVLREKQKMWNDVIASTNAELAAWNQLDKRALTPDSDILQDPEFQIDQYLQQHDLQDLLKNIEYHEPILKGFLSISVKADNIYKASQASSQIFCEAMSTQEQIARWVTLRSLKPIQKTIDPQTALLNVINSRVK